MVGTEDDKFGDVAWVQYEAGLLRKRLRKRWERYSKLEREKVLQMKMRY